MKPAKIEVFLGSYFKNLKMSSKSNQKVRVLIFLLAFGQDMASKNDDQTFEMTKNHKKMLF